MASFRPCIPAAAIWCGALLAPTVLVLCCTVTPTSSAIWGRCRWFRPPLPCRLSAPCVSRSARVAEHCFLTLRGRLRVVSCVLMALYVTPQSVQTHSICLQTLIVVACKGCRVKTTGSALVLGVKYGQCSVVSRMTHAFILGMVQIEQLILIPCGSGQLNEVILDDWSMPVGAPSSGCASAVP